MCSRDTGVFWKHGRNRFRKTPSGEPVRTYDQLCQYLSTRVPRIRETTLPFHGQSRVFFWLPDANHTSDADAEIAADSVCLPCGPSDGS